ncbi:MAG TPA: NAD(P)/FAD-dependent oxidoreductase [Gemmatimonadota bacterium]|nr:NAD(P)/FAD-dependent oxidoreductase [Gemmatimonadota bacterium]
MKPPARVVILGGGFGGLYAARHLERQAHAGVSLDITLVSRDNFLLFTPMLHEVAASDLDVTHIVNPLRKLIRECKLVVGEVEEIDLEERRVAVSHAGGSHRHDLPYEHLVLALGSVTNFFGLPGLAERALTMKSLADAIGLRNRLISLLEEADYECASGDRSTLLTVLVAGGGFAGVETVAAVHDFLHDAVRHYPHLSEELIHVVLVEAAPAILPELGPELGEYTRRVLGERGIDVRTQTAVLRVEGDQVVLGDGSAVRAGTIVWTAGVAPNPLVAGLPCATERGRIRVDPMLRVPEWQGVWALGDCAAVPDTRRGGFHPPTAQHAIRQAKVLAANLAASELVRPLEPFQFSTLGLLAATGRRTGVARMFGFSFSGFLAWWLWRSVYLMKLPRFERRVRVVLDWTLDLLFSKDLTQIPTERPALAAPLPMGAPPAPVAEPLPASRPV